MELISGVHCDALTIALEGSPESHGFARRNKKLWTRPGWRAVERQIPTMGLMTYAQADEAMVYSLGYAMDPRWPFGEARITRVDVCRDVVGVPIVPELVRFVGGHRGRCSYGEQDYYPKVTVSSRESALYTRLYVKPPTDYKMHHIAVWTANGWRGQEVVRVEFERKREGVAVNGCDSIKGFADITDRLDKWWADSLARVRVLAKRRDAYSEVNDVPTNEAWSALGAPMKRRYAKATHRPLEAMQYLHKALAEFKRRGGTDEDLLGALIGANDDADIE